MGKASRLREIRRRLRGDQADSIRVKLHASDDARNFSVGQTYTMPGVKGLHRRYRHHPVYVTAVDEVNGIITFTTSAP